MNISGIRPISGYYDYNEIEKVAEVPVTPVEKPVEPVQKVTERTPEIEAQQTFGAYDYANQYNPDATYSLKGEESDIRSLDVEKAVSNMRKDEVIHQYQYFVGQSMGLQSAGNNQASVRGAEDFSL